MPAVLIFVAVIAAFWPALSASFIWDDDVLLTANPLIRGPLSAFWFTTKAVDYYPLTYSSLWLEWRLWGSNPAGYHITNVLLHAFSCVILWRGLERLKIPAAWLAALLFAVHPVNVESVAWVAERKNVLAMFFYAVTFWSFVRFAQGGERRFYVISLVAFLLSCLAKSAVAGWPIVAFALLCFTEKGSTQTIPARLRCVLPFFAIIVILSAATVWFQYHHDVANLSHYKRADFLTRMTVAGSSLWFYMWKAMVPVALTICYPRWDVAPHPMLFWLAWGALLGLVGVLWFFRKTGGSTVLLALGYFALLLGPVLGIFDIAYYRYSFVADRWQYFALPAVMVLVAIALKRFKLQYVVGISLAVLFAALTFSRSRVYHDTETVWTDAVRKNPSCWVGYNSLGYVRQAEGKLDAAVELYQQSLKVHPEQAEAHSNLGGALLELGKIDEAIGHLQNAIEIHPDYTLAYFNLGCALQRKGDNVGAIDAFRQTIRRAEAFADAHYNLAIALLRTGDAAAAEPEYRAAIRYKPEFVAAYCNLGALLCLTGRREQAVVELQRALTIAPGDYDALVNMGETLVELRKPEKALPYLQKAIAVNPNSAQSRALLGNALMAAKQPGLAEEQFKTALTINPRIELALYGMAACLRRSGHTNEAVQLYEQLLTNNPRHAEAHYQLAVLLASQQLSGVALEHFREAVRNKPEWFEAVHGLARHVAASAATKPAEAAEAVRFAQRAVELTGGSNAVALDTLGIAWARNEVFSKASEAERQAMQVAARNGQTQLVADIQRRLELYKKGMQAN